MYSSKVFLAIRLLFALVSVMNKIIKIVNEKLNTHIPRKDTTHKVISSVQLKNIISLF